MMLAVARDRIATLLLEAEVAAGRGDQKRADRYVELARKIAARYNVRVPLPLRDVYCRGCGAYRREGVTCRTRLNRGWRTRTCLRCGRLTRDPLPSGLPEEHGEIPGSQPLASGVLVNQDEDDEDLDEGDEI